MTRIILTVEDCRGYEIKEKAFRVAGIINTVDFRIGEFLTEEKVRELCAMSFYDVKIIPMKKG